MGFGVPPFMMMYFQSEVDKGVKKSKELEQKLAQKKEYCKRLYGENKSMQAEYEEHIASLMEEIA